MDILWLLIVVILVLLVVGAMPTWPYSRGYGTTAGWGWGPSGGLIGLLLVILLVYFLVGHR